MKIAAIFALLALAGALTALWLTAGRVYAAAFAFALVAMYVLSGEALPTHSPAVTPEAEAE